jgi:hypothetical protein
MVLLGTAANRSNLLRRRLVGLRAGALRRCRYQRGAEERDRDAGLGKRSRRPIGRCRFRKLRRRMSRAGAVSLALS